MLIERRLNPVFARILRAVLLSIALLALGALALNAHTPLLLRLRGIDVRIAVLAAVVIAIWMRSKNRLAAIVALVITFVAIDRELTFESAKKRVLTAPRTQLARLGRHVMVGYENEADAIALIETGGIGGVYVGRKNAAHKNAGELRAHIQRLKSRASGSTFFVAADQEGGTVSWLSPALTSFPPLSTFAGDEDLAPVEAQARAQAIELAWAGVDVDFAPVVDLRPAHTSAIDLHSRISERAISADPEIVTQVAKVYAGALAKEGVIPTLKHFPGLGRIDTDTHLFEADVAATIEELEASDWQPFRTIVKDTNAFMMIGHVRLDAIDKENIAPASISVVEGIIRGRWGHDGVLVTDDLCMGPAFSAAGGVGGTAVRAINAGVDLLLVSQDPEQYYRVMAGLIEAEDKGELDETKLAKSTERLEQASLRVGDVALAYGRQSPM